ncbi:hypothetical protein DFQ27_006618 [Actinomortierella ambigua]|uniref:F-box domain-containing protein n=1 Tax=Actinomortierella ambigua TaxID=1343610 RepID=A0A9P6U169_9FUNG|nr:hypothetical protein DFQ27_006618 [Actinomortierella ambigua]
MHRGTLPTELFESILSHLCQPDLVQCIHLDRFLSDETQQALVKNSAFVRELHLCDGELYDLLLLSSIPHPSETESNVQVDKPNTSIFTGLRAIELHPLNHSFKVNRGILDLAVQNPFIRRFVVRVDMDPEVLVRLVSECLPNLRDFCLDGNVRLGFRGCPTWRVDIKKLLESLSECIQTVTLRRVYYQPLCTDKEPKVESSVDAARLIRHHHALESLHIDGDLMRRESEILVPFLESCSHRLQSVTGLGMTFLTHPAIVGTLSKIGYAPKVLDGDSFQQCLSDIDLAGVISHSSQWTRIWLETSTIGPRTADAIVDNGANLESLEIVYHGGWEPRMTGSHLQRLLSKAKRLKTLVAHYLVDRDMITATDILSSEWATTLLEHIDFMIDIPRPGDDASSLSPDSPAAQSSRAIQRQVLRRLGQQKNLRKLLIGGKVLSSSIEGYDYQRNCLEMTLDSGLDELAGLKNLEELDIRHMDHRVGVPELMWMTQHFPNLQHVYGIFDAPEYPSEEVDEWLQVHRSDWVN